MDELEQARHFFDRPLIELLQDYWWAAATAAFVLLLVLWAILERIGRIFRRRQADQLSERGLEEHLANYPPPEGSPGPRRLLVEGWPVRVRLLVVAPMGKESPIAAAEVYPLLEQMFRGWGEILRQDRPRVRVWPPQLSSHGFGPTFHRLVKKPERDGQPSHWVLVAGQTPSRPRPLLLGLALWADEPNTLGRLTLEPGQWLNVLSIRTLEK